MLSYLHPFKLKHWVPCWQNLSSISIGCQVNTEQTVRKIVRNGQVLILRGGKTYTLTGIGVR